MEQFSSAANRIPDIYLPPMYWGALSQEDRSEFMRLRSSFYQGQKISSKDRRVITFRRELHSVLNYIERSKQNAEQRSILVGICFAGQYICVNTRQLKSFLGRCKSSINGSFQQMGYVALRTKAKAKNCVVSILPLLSNEPTILRQWTVRCASDDAKFCFLSSFTHIPLPDITDDDLYDDKRSGGATSHRNHVNVMRSQPPMSEFQQVLQRTSHPTEMHRPPLPPKDNRLNFDLPAMNDFGCMKMPELTTSFSVDCFADLDDEWNDSPIACNAVDNLFNDSMMHMKRMPRSFSAVFPVQSDFDNFSDDFSLF